MSEDGSTCPICGSYGAVAMAFSDSISYKCRRCGEYELTGTARSMVVSANPRGRVAANASGWIRENQGVAISSRDLKRLFDLPAPPVAERALKVLREFERRCPEPGAQYIFEFSGVAKDILEWVAVSWSETVSELSYLLVDYLRDSLKALQGVTRGAGGHTTFFEARISPDGFKLLDDLRKGIPQSTIGFCAMWFSPDLMPLWSEAIEPAIANAGYEPKRIDKHEHTNRIDDEIVAMIRRSRFVVADFTGQRGGVYFEAGYALGQGRRVIWTCRQDSLNDVHFDTRQYNFLVWNPGEYADLAKRLQNRIEATLGRGPLS
jgi:hypothetical protein